MFGINRDAGKQAHRLTQRLLIPPFDTNVRVVFENGDGNLDGAKINFKTLRANPNF